jgi:hypothetical protein
MKIRNAVLSMLFACVTLLPSHAALAQFVQQGPKLVGSYVGQPAQGESVAISDDGNTAIVGGGYDGGAAWVWIRSGAVWTQQGPKLVGPPGNFGFTVSLSGDGNTTLVASPYYGSPVATGTVLIWTRSEGIWTQQGPMLVGSGAIGDVYQGESAALSADGNTALVGGREDNGNVGAVWVWTRSGGLWTQQGTKLVAIDAVGNAEQGISVALSADGNTAIVGGFEDNVGVGAAWIWTRIGGVWTQQGAKLVASGATGPALQGTSVALSANGNTAVIGGYFDNNGIGAAWVWTRSGEVWSQQGNKLVGSFARGKSGQGSSVALSADGNIAVIAGPTDNLNDGSLWVWTRSGGVWTQQVKKLQSVEVDSHEMGTWVSLSGDGKTIIAGGPFDNQLAGAAWVFVNEGPPRRHAVRQ